MPTIPAAFGPLIDQYMRETGQSGDTPKAGKLAKCAVYLPWPAVIPMPPSVNSMYRNAGKKGRVKSPSYKFWLDKAVPLLRKWSRPLTYPVAIEIVIHEKMSARSDIDNRCKAVLDAMVAAGVLHDDGRKYVDRLSVRYAGDSTGVSVSVA